jgi:predicted GH43/DUF377 family glycosyl hydrolase
MPKPPSLTVMPPQQNPLQQHQAAVAPVQPPAPAPVPATGTDERICFVQNSKTGDILNIIPILYERFRQTGQKQVLALSRTFRDIVEGCSYIEPIIWDGDWTDLNGLLKMVQAQFKTVVSLSTFGRTLKLVKQTPSFALEQYQLAGMLAQYDTLPLVFDLRNPAREQELLQKYVPHDDPLILVGDHSNSSPFEHTDKLVRLLRDNFGSTHRILRLSEVYADRVFDLHALYERAKCLVSIETMHLHLAGRYEKAPPIVALVTDKPEMWHGTAWHKSFALHCRYADFEQRKDEIVSTVRGILDDIDKPEIQITGTGGYNNSLMEWNGQRVSVYRWHPKPDAWRTELAAWTGQRVVKIAAPKGFEQHSLEDGRLFVHNGKLHLSFTVASQQGCVIQYGEVDPQPDGWRLVKTYQPRYKGNDFSTLQKNWSFWSAGGKLYAAYQRNPEQIVLELDGERVVSEYKTKSPEWAFGQIRGGTFPVERDGLWLQFFHCSTRNNRTAWGWTYYLGALLMETAPPFQITAISKTPILAGTERYFQVPRWKPRILFPGGAIKTDDGYTVSLGVNDAATGKLDLKDEQLNL